MTPWCYQMIYSKRLNNRGKTLYSGHHMPTSIILPGAASLAQIPVLSNAAKKRLKWMDYYHQCRNVSRTCRYFGISRETFYEWQRRYDPFHLESLEEKSGRPRKTRQWEVRREQELRILALRKAHIRWGKMKIQKLYQDQYRE